MLHWSQHILVSSEQVGLGSNGEAEIAEFIRTRGITRCPTACVLPTQGLVAAADRAALEEYAVQRERIRQARLAARERGLWIVAAPVSNGEETAVISEEIES